MKLALLALFLPVIFAGITDLDQVSTVYLAPGASEYLEISSNPTTGYSWVVVSFTSNLFSIEDGGYISDDTGDTVMCGVGGTQIFIAYASSNCIEGDSITIELVYARSWEQYPVDSKTVTLYATNDQTLLSI